MSYSEKDGKELVDSFEKLAFPIPEPKIICFELNTRFWALIPCINLNFQSKEIEIEFLCFGVYFKPLRLFEVYMKGARENDFPISEYGILGEKKKGFKHPKIKDIFNPDTKQ